MPPPSLSASSNGHGGNSVGGDITFSRLTGRYPNRSEEEEIDLSQKFILYHN